MKQVFQLTLHFIRIFLRLTRPLSDAVLDILCHVVMGRSPLIPPIRSSILLMSAAELAEKIRTKKLSSVEVVQAFIDRCREVNGIINAVIDERYDDALDDAKKIDEFLSTNEKCEADIAKDTPLLGIPFSCKESIGVKGMAQLAGLAREKGRLAPQDNESVAFYKNAGAIPLCVTNVPELCLWWDTENTVYGRTRNPYKHTRIAGGSSGGEAALISAAGSLFGLGTDLGGSIRMPACFCGIYGHKTTKGTLSNVGMYPGLDNLDLTPEELETLKAASFSCLGPMCRYVQDLPLLMQVLTNEDKYIDLHKKVDFRKVKIYYMEEIPGYLNATVPEIKSAIRVATNHFKTKFGANPTPLNLIELDHTFQIMRAKLRESRPYALKDLLVGKNGHLNFNIEFIKHLFGYSKYCTCLLLNGMFDTQTKDGSYYKHLRKFDSLKPKLDELFLDDAILLVPTHPELAPHVTLTIPKLPNIAYTGIVNVLGYPATNIPSGMSKGIPFGIQAVSGLKKDHLTIAAAIELDKIFSGWTSPSSVEL